MTYYTLFDFEICTLALFSDGEKIHNICFNFKDYVPKTNEKLEKNDNLPVFIETKKWLSEYLSGKNPSLKNLKLSLNGTPFQLAVWEELKTIPYGKTITYGEISKKVAKKLGKLKLSAQAVGGAVGRNPIPIIIPCHRVVGANNKLTGFHGGLDLKRFLLAKEGIDLTKFKN